jgi:dTDP-4-amino-4,6-dideoxygalactose transaminase
MGNKNHLKPVRDNFLVFGSPAIGEDEINEVVSCLRSGWLGTGPRVAQFEKDFAAYKLVDNTHVAAVNSCTAALHISMIAAGIGPGDEVITTPMTFCASVNAIIHSGATPVLADIDPLTLNINPEMIEAAITPHTRAILPVHFAGRPCEMDTIMTIADKHGLKVIEDCAHAIETEYKGKKAGAMGDFGCFSFYVTKNIVTGEGGMVLARNLKDIERIKVLALHGMSKDAWNRFSDAGYKHYQIVECGFKYNMMDIQAAIGIHQLKRIKSYRERRGEIWSLYMDKLSELPISLPAPVDEDQVHAFHLFTLQIDYDKCGISRDEFLSGMTRQNIGMGVHYLSIPEHPFYQQHYGWAPEKFRNAMKVGRETVSLPLSPALTDQDVNDVIEAVMKLLC